MNATVKTTLNSRYGKEHKLSRKLKAVIGYWTDYFSNKYEDRVSFVISGEKVIITDLDEHYYTIFYKWLQFHVHYMDIFETLDLIEKLLKTTYNTNGSDHE